MGNPMGEPRARAGNMDQNERIDMFFKNGVWTEKCLAILDIIEKTMQVGPSLKKEKKETPTPGCILFPETVHEDQEDRTPFDQVSFEIPTNET